MNDELTPGRQLLMEVLDVSEIAAGIPADADLILAGINSGDLIRLGLTIEDRTHLPLSDDDLIELQTVSGIDRVLTNRTQEPTDVGASLAALASSLTTVASGQLEAPPNLIPHACAAITREMLPLVELQEQHIERIVQAVSGGAANIQDIYPLAPLQEGILFHHLPNEEGGDAYLVQTLLSLSSRERLEQLLAALQAVIDRHDAL